MLSSPGASDDYDGRDYHLECEWCMNAVQASSQQLWLVFRSCWLPAVGHFGRCGVVEGHRRSGHGTSSAGLQVLVDSCGLGCVGGKESEVGSELPGV